MDSDSRQLFPSEENAGERIDIFLTRKLSALSREKIKSAIISGNVNVNGIVLQKPDYKIKGNETIKVSIVAEPPSVFPSPEPIAVPVIYEDDHIIIINKPAGVVTHPTAHSMHNSIVNALLYMNKTLSDMGDPMRPGIIHRLDKQTCGLLIIAKNNESHKKLVEMFKQRTIHKIYIAVVYDVINEQAGVIDSLINRHPIDRKRMTTKTTRGKQAITSFTVIKRFDSATVVMLFPKTGRTHQLRTQFSDIGHPIINDTVYSKKKPDFKHPQLNKMISLLNGIALFAYALSFIHPVYGTCMTFRAPFPGWLKEVLYEHELS